MDFNQNYCLVMKYDGVSDVVSKLGAVPRGSLVKVDGNRLRIIQGQGEVLVDAPTDSVQVRAARRVAPGLASLDIGDQHWLVDFGKVHKSQQMREGGIGSKIAAASAFGNMKAIKVAKEIRTRFVASLESQGATVAD